MFTNKFVRQALLATVAVLFLVSLTGCGNGPEIINSHKKTAASEEDYYFGPSQEDKYPAFDESLRYQGQKFSVSYPIDWGLTENKTTFSVTIKDTDKEVVLGGAAPDDYYVKTASGNAINAERYSTQYSVITADYSEKSEAMTWRQFFDQFEVVERFEKYSGKIPAGMEAMVVTKVSGLFPGQKRVFLRQGAKFLDLSLFVSGEDEKSGEAIFNKVVASVAF